MTVRATVSGLTAMACLLLRADDLGASEPAAARGQEPPTARAVWPERATGADLFSPRRADPPVAGNAVGSSDHAPGESVTPFVLVEVRAADDGLRLIGHTGAGRSLRGVFALPGGGSVLARAGEPVGAEGLTVRAMELRRVREDGETVRRARAVLVRGLSGEIVTLDARANPDEAATLMATLRSIPSGATSEVKVGDRLEWDGQIYLVGPIGLQPPTVEVAWTDSAGVRRVSRLALPDGSGRGSP